MSLNVGSIAVGMNVDLAEFETGMRKATALASSHTALMSAEMKRQSREGAESMRLIDEAIGVHISRPLTRVIAQLPGIGTALAALGGIGGAAGVIALIGVGWEKVVPAIERVAKEYGLLADSAEEMAKSMKRSDQEIVAGLQRKIELQDAYNKLVLGMKGAEAESAHLAVLKQTLEVEAKLYEQQVRALQLRSFNPTTGDYLKGLLGSLLELESRNIFSGQAPAAIQDNGLERFKKSLEGLKPLFDEIRKLQVDIQKSSFSIIADDREKIQEQNEGLHKLGDALYKLHEAAVEKAKPALEQLGDELQKTELKAAGYYLIVGDTGWYARFRQSYSQYIQDLRDANTQKEAALLLEKALKEEAFGSPKDRATSLSGIFAPPILPTLATGASPLSGAFDEFAHNAVEQNRLIEKAFQDALSPADKFKLTIRELDLVLKNADGTFKAAAAGAAAYAGAVQKAREELLHAESALVRMQNQLQKLLEHTDSAKAGFQAFLIQLQIDAASTGRFTFEILNRGLQGFEDNLARTLTTGRANWRQYFEEIEQLAIKFALNKVLAGILGHIGFGSASSAASGATLTAAGTTLTTAGTLLNTAASQLIAAATTLSASAAGGSGGGGFAGLIGLALGGRASGGDVTPGGTYLVGENGPEILSLGAGSSGYITPNSDLGKGGGDSSHIYIDARGADAGVEQRIHRAMRAYAEVASAHAVTMVSENGKRRPR